MTSTQQTEKSANRAWYRHPMMLLVVGIPLLSVVVSFTYLGIAVRTFDGVVVDDYYRQGKEINRTLQRDRVAQQMGITARIEFEDNQVSATLSSTLTAEWPESIDLKILHPTQDGYDISRSLKLKRPPTSGNAAYVASVSEFHSGDWILQLETPEWRLTSRERLSTEFSGILGGD